MHKRKRNSPVLKKSINDKLKGKRRHTSSSSDTGTNLLNSLRIFCSKFFI